MMIIKYSYQKHKLALCDILCLYLGIYQSFNVFTHIKPDQDKKKRGKLTSPRSGTADAIENEVTVWHLVSTSKLCLLELILTLHTTTWLILVTTI